MRSGFLFVMVNAIEVNLFWNGMTKICDNKSVGQIIKKGHSFVVIERHNYPQAFAFVAGHCDGDNFANAATKESREEAGVEIIKNKLVWSGKIDNPCKREGGSFHDWEIFEAESWHGDLVPGDDAKRFFLGSLDNLKKLGARTDYFAKKYGINYEKVGELTLKIFGSPTERITDPEWVAEPGLEPVWYFILKQIDTI